ncbi:hypothetical protein A3Q56_06901 [Intoshia linei]|uniref:Uncharacterized protein n=1 Tax=Intoshia linei TaxID=1819745 RepID=A0A177ATR2_9BILA|nr:hypothetical protein A3Q56_06901 [Intoshia linei]
MVKILDIPNYKILTDHDRLAGADGREKKCYGKMLMDCGNMKNVELHITDTVNIIGCKALIESGAITIHPVDLNFKYNWKKNNEISPKKKVIRTLDKIQPNISFINPEFVYLTHKYNQIFAKTPGKCTFEINHSIKLPDETKSVRGPEIDKPTSNEQSNDVEICEAIQHLLTDRKISKGNYLNKLSKRLSVQNNKLYLRRKRYIVPIVSKGIIEKKSNNYI